MCECGLCGYAPCFRVSFMGALYLFGELCGLTLCVKVSFVCALHM